MELLQPLVLSHKSIAGVAKPSSFLLWFLQLSSKFADDRQGQISGFSQASACLTNAKVHPPESLPNPKEQSHSYSTSVRRLVPYLVITCVPNADCEAQACALHPRQSIQQ